MVAAVLSPGCRWWSRGGRQFRHRDCGCSRWSPGPEHSQLMANDVRPWALSRLPVAPRESPEDRRAAPSALQNERFSLISRREIPLLLPALSGNSFGWPPSPTTYSISRVICVHCVPETRDLILSFLFFLIHTHGFRFKSRTGPLPCTENPKREDD